MLFISLLNMVIISSKRFTIQKSPEVHVVFVHVVVEKTVGGFDRNMLFTRSLSRNTDSL